MDREDRNIRGGRGEEKKEEEEEEEEEGKKQRNITSLGTFRRCWSSSAPAKDTFRGTRMRNRRRRSGRRG